jgi:hypothetical protein
MGGDDHFLICTEGLVAASSEEDPDVCHADTGERIKVQKQRWGRHNCAKGSRNSNFQSHTHPIKYIEDGAEVHCEVEPEFGGSRNGKPPNKQRPGFYIGHHLILIRRGSSFRRLLSLVHIRKLEIPVPGHYMIGAAKTCKKN